ncbi:MAG TPA: hypothetical protein VHR65_05275, partial [Solirubrobacterales bacterium]|nr:hypothetical protein [Solirubrobacterales bacterium]
ISWPALDAARERHEVAVEALSAAREAGDAEAEAEALAAVCDAVIEADAKLRASVGAEEAQFAELAAEVHPPGRVIEHGEGAANAARIAEIRGPIEADQKIARRVTLGLLESDTFESERGDRIRPQAVVEAMRAKGAIR